MTVFNTNLFISAIVKSRVPPIDNEIINLLYQQYSKFIPFVGKYIVGSSKPYDYLIRSIDEFYTQNELVDLMKNNGFSNVEYRNLSNGISAIHSGWKI